MIIATPWQNIAIDAMHERQVHNVQGWLSTLIESSSSSAGYV